MLSRSTFFSASRSRHRSRSLEVVQIIPPERLQQLTVEHLVDVAAPHVMNEIVEVVRVVEMVEVLVAQIQEPIVELVIPRERVPERIAEQIGGTVSLQIEEEIGDVVRTLPQERIQHCIVEQIVAVCASHGVERIGWQIEDVTVPAQPGESGI